MFITLNKDIISYVPSLKNLNVLKKVFKIKISPYL